LIRQHLVLQNLCAKRLLIEAKNENRASFQKISSYTIYIEHSTGKRK